MLCVLAVYYKRTRGEEVNEPTGVEVKEFWELCLRECVHDWEKTLIKDVEPEAYSCVCKKCDRRFDFCGGRFFAWGNDYEFPPIDLNNLFKYAVPKVKEYYKELSTPGYFVSAVVFFENWVDEWLIDSNKDPALTLFWACYKVMKEGV